VNHLGEAAQQELALPDAERVASIDRRRWYSYPAAERLIDYLQQVRDYPKGPRMPSVFLESSTGNGKTSSLKRFEAENPIVENPSGEGVIIPVIRMQAPPSADEGLFLSDALSRVTDLFNERDKPANKIFQLVRLLKRVGTKVWAIDDLQNIESGPGPKQQHFLKLLRYLTNELDVAMVIAGTEEARSLVASDPQMESRLEFVSLPIWREGEDFLCLLDSLEARFPLRKASNLASSDLATLVLALSKGTLAGILRVVRGAAKRAIETGRERITPDLIAASEGDIDVDDERRVS
jgi:hypothetical protein